MPILVVQKLWGGHKRQSHKTNNDYIGFISSPTPSYLLTVIDNISAQNAI